MTSQEMQLIRVVGVIGSIAAIFAVQWFWGWLWDRWRDHRERKLYENSYAGRMMAESWVDPPAWMQEQNANKKAAAFEKWLLGLYEIAQDSETPDEYFARSAVYLQMDRICTPQYHEFRLAMQGRVWNTHAEHGPDEVHAQIRNYARSAAGLR